MKFAKFLTLFTAFSLLVSLFLPLTSASAATDTLLPAAYLTTAGSDGSQPVANLQVQDQSGSQDDWDKYVEFSTPSVSYAGYRSYTLPAGINPADISALQLTASYKGPVKSYQTWTWKIYNWNTSAWVSLGDNASAPDWTWILLSFTASGTPADYVNASTREIRINLQSNNAKDNALLDYEAISITSGGSLITSTSVPPTATFTATTVPATATFTATLPGPTATFTSTSVPPTATFTRTPAPATATFTATSIPPTATFTRTALPPTATFTSTAFPPTSTSLPATNTPQPGVCTRFVATTGSDSNNGSTLTSPWKTVQKAANSALPGDIVCVRAGTYTEKVTLGVSGTAAAYITFQSYPGETAILDGTGIAVPNADTGMFFVQDKAYLIIKGFEVRNYKTSTKNYVPIGIRITGTSHHIEIRGNKIHNIEHNGTSSSGTDAHGIAIHGTSGTTAITNVIVDGNELYSLKLGSSEALVINGNVDGWQVTNNLVHDVNNIGIDAIGFESTAPSNDQARNGLIAHNDVYNITSSGNVAYGTDRSAGCIYVDGGRDIVIEYNKAHNCNLGVEIASEHAGKATSNVTVRNNFIYGNTDVGIAMGGYDTQRGSTENCVIVNNTLYNNNTSNDWGSELYIQYDTRNNTIKNNIIFAGSPRWFIRSWSAVMSGNLMDYNLFFATGGTGGNWQWKNVSYTAFASYQSASTNDAHSLNGLDPLFVAATSGNLHLQNSSPAINAGQNLSTAGSYDIDGETRTQNTIDIGADEVR